MTLPLGVLAEVSLDTGIRFLVISDGDGRNVTRQEADTVESPFREGSL
ncbi:hypothetical protein V2E29_36900 [Streptomyces diastatochromogenes]